ncbi:MAG: hypothetical protein WD691_06490 [Acidimicrobiales bacterium]
MGDRRRGWSEHDDASLWRRAVDQPREAVPFDLLVAELAQALDQALLSHDHRWNAQVGIAGLTVDLRSELPPRHERGDHVAADDAVPRRAEDTGQVAERDVTEVVGDGRRRE